MNEERIEQYEAARDKLDGMLLEAIDMLRAEFEAIKSSNDPVMDKLLELIDSSLDFRRKLDLITGSDAGGIRAGAKINRKFN